MWPRFSFDLFCLLKVKPSVQSTDTFRRNVSIVNQMLHDSNKFNHLIVCHHKLSFEVTMTLIVFKGSRTIPRWIKIKPIYCPPGPQSLGLLPTRTTPHQDHDQRVKPLIRTNICMVGNCPGGELSGYSF